VAFSKGSHHWAASPTMLYDIMARRKTLFAPEDLERYGIRPFERVCGKAGSLFCFCSNAIHSATNVQPGRERWSLHLYYYGRRLWSSDKKERAGERRA